MKNLKGFLKRNLITLHSRVVKFLINTVDSPLKHYQQLNFFILPSQIKSNESG